MAFALPKPEEMFGSADPVALAERFEAYKAALASSHDRSLSGDYVFVPKVGIVPNQAKAAEAMKTAMATLTKSADPDTLASIQSQIAQSQAYMADLTKDWTTSNPLSTGLVPFDLQAPAKFLVPRQTPLRNDLTREPGQGLSARFKRILGISNAGVGGVGDTTTFFNSETTTNTFGGVAGLRRPNKITYASDEKVILYQEQGLSDSVTYKADYTARGFQNLRQLSQTSLLWATLMGEEKGLLYARGTGTGFEGAIAQPTGVTAVASSGGSLAAGTVFVKVTARGGVAGGAVGVLGESVPSAEVSVSVTANQLVTVTVGTEPTGALGYNVYASTATGTEVFQGIAQGNTFVIKSLTTGTAAPQAADSSGNANAYDGFLTIQADPAVSGYVTRLNANFASSNPGTEYQTAFTSMYNTNRADPDEIWLYAGGRVALSDLLKTANSANYRLTLDSDGTTGHQLGAVVTGVQNEVTTKMVDLMVHPFMPIGASFIRSRTLPIPDSEVSETATVRNVQDYASFEWPEIQMTYDQSTYMLGSLIHYAPAWSGAVLGITN